MNRTAGLIMRATLVCMLVFALLPGSAAAQEQPPDAPPPPLTIVLPVPDAAELQVPPGLSHIQMQEVVEESVYRQARPLLEQLKRLQYAGAVASYELNASLSSIEIQPSSEQGIEQVRALAGSFSFFTGQKQAGACQQNTARALQGEVQTLSRLAEKSAAQAEVQAADAGLTVVASDGGLQDAIYGGVASAYTSVSLSLSRAGQQLFNTTVWSDEYGFYSLTPAWLDDCTRTNPYAWWLLPGDVITAKSGARTTSITVEPLTGWADYDTQTVAGSSTAGKTINIFSVFDTGSCSVAISSGSTTAGSSGSFEFNLSASPFQRSAYFWLDTITEDGNGTEIFIDAMQLNIYAQDARFYGTLHPNRTVEVTYEDAGGPVETWTGRTASDGRFDGAFLTVLPVGGEQVTATDGETTITLAIVDAAITPNIKTGLAAGSTAPGRQVRVDVNSRTFGSLITACSTRQDNTCRSAISDAGGNFGVNLPTGVNRGDRVVLAIFDSQGNAQIHNQLSIPAVLADLSGNVISGYWHLPNAPVTVTTSFQNGGSSVYDLITTPDANFTLPLPESISPFAGDTVKVEGGGLTETLTIGSLTGKITHEGETLFGTSSGSHVIADLWDFWPEEAGYYGECKEKVNPGEYSFDFSLYHIGGGDWVDLYSRTVDGNYLYRFVPTLSLYIYQGAMHSLVGYTSRPNETVIIKIDNVNISPPIQSDRLTGYFSADLPFPLLGGKTMNLTFQETTRSIYFYPLTAVRDGAANTVSGFGPPNTQVWPAIYGYTSPDDYQGYRLPVRTGSNGAYTASFANAHYEDCSPVQVGDACAVAGLSYYAADDQYVALVPEAPGAVQSDPSEEGAGDDQFSTAKPYDSGTVHTFETGVDQDWVTFTIAPEDAGRLVTIQAVRTGHGMQVDFSLWDQNQQLVPTGSSSSTRGTILTAVLDAGDYYLRATPLDNSIYGYCGAFYQILVTDQALYLPSVRR